MNIGITCYPVPGGSGVVATELGLELAKRGYQVHFISYAIPFRLPKYQENLFFHEVEVMNYPLFKYPPYTLTLATKMAEIAEQFDLQILHVHYAIPHATCAFLAKQLIKKNKPKIITTLHGTDITLVGNDKSFFGITKFSIEASDGITAVSNFLKEETKREFKIEKEIEVIPNFVDSKRFSDQNPACQREKFAKADEKILMHMSNFRPVKRIEDVVKVFHLVNKNIPSKLILIGDGPEISLAMDLIKTWGIEKKVIWLGNQEYVENLLCLADLFLLPSNKESFGLAALEALSCGVPVIGTDLGGLPEVVRQGETGFLRNLGDVQGMAEKALEILGDKKSLEQFKKNAREKAVELFDASRIIPQYENYYQKILNQKE
jgi:N-acetyl-alpha-D-glucosaminyl L-malate synthase BshA